MITRRHFLHIFPAGILSGCVQTLPTREENQGLVLPDRPRARQIFADLEAGRTIEPAFQREALNMALADFKADFLNDPRIATHENLNTRIIAPFVGSFQSPRRPSAATNQTFKIPPRSLLAFKYKGHCMNKSLPAPVVLDALYFEKLSTRVDADLIPVFKAINSNIKTDYIAQDLIWLILGIGTQKIDLQINNLPQTHQRALQESYPGGLDIIRRKHNELMGPQKLISGALKIAGVNVSTTDLEGFFSQKNTGATLAELIAQGEKITEGRGVGYSELAAGVSARSQAIAPLSAFVQIVNNSANEYIFDPSDWLLKPAAQKQSISPAVLSKMKEVATKTLKPDSSILETAAAMTKDISRSLIEEGWRGAWDLLKTKTPGAVRTATKAAALSPVLGTALKAAPVVGNAISGYEFITGLDFLTGETLGPVERAVAGIGTVTGLNTLRSLGGVWRMAQTSSELAGFLVTDTAQTLGSPIATFNDENRDLLKNLVIQAELPWQPTTKQFIKSLSGT